MSRSKGVAGGEGQKERRREGEKERRREGEKDTILAEEGRGQEITSSNGWEFDRMQHVLLR